MSDNRSDLRSVLADFGAKFSGDVVGDFGSPEEEYRSLVERSVPLLVPLLATTPLKLTGEDRVPFLHGQVSNDVVGLQEGGANRALLLTHRGHAAADMTVVRRRDDLYALVDGGRGPEVEASFRRHIIFDQVEIEDLTGVLTTLTLLGEGAPDILASFGAVPDRGRLFEGEVAGVRVLVHRTARTGFAGFDIHLRVSDLVALIAGLLATGPRLAGEVALDCARVEAGVPAAATEAGEGVLPQEAGLVGAVSFEKGCYLGQEIMARIDARGRVRRGLAGVRFDRLPAFGMREVTFQGRRVGLLGRTLNHPTFGPVGLAVLRHDIPVGTKLEVGETGLKRTRLPFRPNSRSDDRRGSLGSL